MQSEIKPEIYRRLLSFRYAFDGCWYVLRTQRNAWIHAVVNLLVVLMAFWLQLPGRDWAILILAMMAVWVAEFLNTAVETVVDIATPGLHPLAKIAKDAAAAAVLLAAIGSVLIGLLLLGPPLLAFLWGN